ncbi:VOC family protein [Paracidovorax cattleyae]|uniref:PhnB protein n=1 Tax=Paracidovorax cattleyae TaxID=80868 RepID=A0A1H0PCT8_9BURK|nr:VOC family protein [Paracidovorax cattleyae]AVS76032.1 VOC family protein [Paracidovorax cattleyae]SDP02804.1 PhnB protein [Paracidovorax cattleyae]
MKAQPYLFFNGRCEEALAFYRKALGAEVTALMRFQDNPAPPQEGTCGGAPGAPAPSPDKVMHAEFRIGETHLMASDGMCGGQPRFEGISLALTPADAADTRRVFAALAEGGQVQMPLGPAFFSPAFGVVADRFGVPWMVVAPQP